MPEPWLISTRLWAISVHACCDWSSSCTCSSAYCRARATLKWPAIPATPSTTTPFSLQRPRHYAGERDALAHQLEQYSHLDRLHAAKLAEVHAAHARALKDAQGDAGQKLRLLYQSSARAFQRLRGLRHLGRVVEAWSALANRTRRVKWAQRVWGLRRAASCFEEWHLLVLERK